MAGRLDVIRFTATVEKMTGRFAWHYVKFPHHVEKLFGKKGLVRVKGTMNGVPMDRALMPRKSGYHMIVLSAEMRKKAKVKTGDTARFEVWLNKMPDQLDVPEELQETLDFFPEFNAGWERMRPGMKRSILIWINNGKTVPTKAKRVGELLLRFETGHTWFRRTNVPDRSENPRDKE